jgi:rhamnose utilization protein RhaD (predicted bifunctional aldolase and dehydrogenase)/NAD(P)-dependent dehydrogenase (short-subunit alcohol dehydrogenase family)
MESRWNEAEAAQQPELEGLLYASRLVGAEQPLVVWGGGNTSAKVWETDFRGRRVYVLRVKGSGSDLRTIERKDFPGVRLEDVLPLRERDAMTDEAMVAYLAHTLVEPASPRPSIETLLHAFLPARVVIHTHADAILALTNTPSGRRWVREALGPRAIWIDYRRPGFALSKQVAEAYEADPEATCVVLEKHGLITWGETARQAYEATIEAVTKAEQFIAARRREGEGRRPGSAALDAGARRRVFVAVAPLIRGLAGRTTPEGDVLPPGDAHRLPASLGRMVLRFDDSPDVLSFASDPDAARLSQIGPATPDHLINTKRTALYVPAALHRTTGEGDDSAPGFGGGTTAGRALGAERTAQEALDEAGAVAGAPSHPATGGERHPEAAAIAAIEQALEPAWRSWVQVYLRYVRACAGKGEGAPVPAQIDPRPRVILLPGVGMVTLGRDARAARISADIYHHAVATIRDAEAVEAYASLDEQSCYDVEYWPLELYKLTLAPPEKELARRVAVVTGGASGIGRAIAERLAAEGAHVVILDKNAEGAGAVAAALERQYGDGRALAVPTDVTDEASVLRAFTETVAAYGGVDIVVSNAGLARSHPVEETSLEEWRLLQDVLATGYFLVSREAFRIFKRQGTGGSVVFVASKNALVAGKDNTAYSAAKAAELHLARCLAEEGGPHGVRVNTVCPDAVLQGSGIWTAGWREERARTYGIRPEELEEFYRRRTTLKVNVFPQDVAEAVFFFASDRAAKTTGGVLTVDGGVAAAYVR